jgi:dipeptidase E
MEGAPQIVAFGGGGFSMEAGNPLMDEYVLGLVDRERPRVCFLPSASGDADHYIVRFFRHFPADRCEPSHVSLFRRERGIGGDLREHLLAQDVIYVGGGSVISLLGVWQAHRVDEVLREAWARGIVLCGLSAGSLCWFSEGVTAFHGVPEPVAGLGILPYSNAVHYDGEPSRQGAYHRFLAEGMRAGYACQDGAALHFRGTELARVVASRREACAYHVACVDGQVIETALAADYLGEEPAAPALADVLAA